MKILARYIEYLIKMKGSMIDNSDLIKHVESRMKYVDIVLIIWTLALILGLIFVSLVYLIPVLI